METWKDVKGYEGIYQVSSHGRVKSLARVVNDIFGEHMTEEIIMHPGKGKHYYHVRLCKNGAKETTSVHRLVAKTFIRNPDNKPCVNHIDGNKLNNHVENLEWVTYSENIQHAIRTGLKKPQKRKRQIEKVVEKVEGSDGVKETVITRLRPRVVKYDSSLNPVAIYETKKHAEDENGLYSIRVGIAKSYNGFYYAEEGDPMNTRQWDRVRGKKIPV